MKVFLVILAILVLLFLAVLFLNVGIEIKHNKKLKIFFRVSFLKFDLTRQKKQKKCKIQSLETYIKKNQKNKENTRPEENTLKDTGLAQLNSESAQTGQNDQDLSDSEKTTAQPEKSVQMQKVSDIKEAISNCHNAEKSTKVSIGEKVSFVSQIVKTVFNGFGKYATIKIKQLGITACRREASQTAMEYAFWNVTANNLVTLAREYRMFKISKGVPTVMCDFIGDDCVPKFFADIRISVYVWQALLCVVKPLKYTKNSNNKSGKVEVKNG